MRNADFGLTSPQTWHVLVLDARSRSTQSSHTDLYWENNDDGTIRWQWLHSSSMCWPHVRLCTTKQTFYIT
jgi:hypothetical protein